MMDPLKDALRAHPELDRLSEESSKASADAMEAMRLFAVGKITRAELDAARKRLTGITRQMQAALRAAKKR